MRSILLTILILLNFSVNAQEISTAKPWTFWWWMGSAVTKQDITKQLEIFQKSGLGGVHIIPIYGVKGAEAGFIPFLGPNWLDMMGHTVREGKRLGLGVDLSTGTGWPFGGPNVPVSLGAKQMDVKGGKPSVKNTKQAVKRAAPGGEGLVFDPFHKNAMSQYLTRFDSAFATVKDLPRSMYMDSYEAYGANWTDDFPQEFQKRRAYNIESKLALLKDSTGSEDSKLVKMDYHQTLAELLRERYAHPWTDWSTKHKFLTRYQAHGSPGNLLDLYEEADIPETESFGTSRFDIPGLRIDPDYSIKQFGTPNPLAMKFASSAAHFSGKKLVSSETGTWLANHFKVSLSQIKPQLDELFTAGINHIFYHGTTYSPINEVYPGWLFYASTNFGPNSHFAEHFALLNKYVENCQNLLQNSKPDNDVLVYFPIHDLWSTPGKSGGGVHLLEVHHVDRWLLDLPFGKLSQKLWKEGYAFDFVSDSQLNRLHVSKNGNVSSDSTSYKTILIPSETFMPEETLLQLTKLAKAGAKIVFEGKTPDSVTGYANHGERQKVFNNHISEVRKLPSVQVGNDLDKMLLKNGVVNEELAKKGLTFIRKKSKDGKVFYFVANVSSQFTEGWVSLGQTGKISKFDPLKGESVLPYRNVNGKSEIYLSLMPGESAFLKIAKDNSLLALNNSIKKEFPVDGSWKIDFVKGKPTLPASAKINTLQSWTTLPDSAVYFSGTARYSFTFNASEEMVKSKILSLHLGDVREVAAVKLNGKSVGTAWSIPFNLDVPSGLLKAKNNLLEIEVTNLSANYMRLRDRQAPDWKKFYDINIVDITYKKFDASSWEPMPSGLLGPIKFVYQ
ncbi:glycosyl hydrolase [Dyadobacter psychrotolerans]|uniref:Glycoside hydrolase n=1 Tax=Dyadobacter psychrotolerans TaxID=2541721 RepID=A0A4R5DNR1_9BACT|nr:glycosyl hydrolase [Dyadobacter psychrotolerans]TDE12353.1 glycoside hydrolase [Dyadobacter psychrotolerans]